MTSNSKKVPRALKYSLTRTHDLLLAFSLSSLFCGGLWYRTISGRSPVHKTGRDETEALSEKLCLAAVWFIFHFIPCGEREREKKYKEEEGREPAPTSQLLLDPLMLRPRLPGYLGEHWYNFKFKIHSTSLQPSLRHFLYHSISHRMGTIPLSS